MGTVAILLAAVALLTGAVAGVLDALKLQDIGPWKCFLIHIGLTGVVSTTFAESMEILPLALLFAAATGVVPFILAYFSLRAFVANSKRV